MSCGQHARFHRVHADVSHHGVNLQAHKVSWQLDHSLDPYCVLGGDGGDGAHAVYAQGGEGLEVGLDASSAAGVRASDG